MNDSPRVPWPPSPWVVGTTPRPHWPGCGDMSWSLVVFAGTAWSPDAGAGPDGGRLLQPLPALASAPPAHPDPPDHLGLLSLLISFIYIEMVLENTRYANTQTGGGG